MEIIVVSAVYPPEPIISAITSSQIADTLSKQNNKVQVITNYPNRPEGKIFPGYHRHLYSKQILSDHYSILRCFSTFSASSSLLSRLLENFSFGIISSLALLFSKKPDVIYVNTWPIIAQGLVSLVAHLRKIPLVLSIQDIYPESLVSQGRIRSKGLVYKFLLGIDRRITRGCKSIIVISDSFTKSYRELRGIPTEKIHVVPNWIDSRTVQPTNKDKYRNKCDISKTAFVLVYGGNIGRAAGVESVLRSLENVKSDGEIVFIIAGSGPNLEGCRQISKKLSNVRVVFHSPWLEEETSEVLGAADVLVLPTHGEQSLASMPSKMITNMLAARPILAAVQEESDIAGLIGKTGCGWVVPPDSPEHLARKTEEVSKISKIQLTKIGLLGREYALSHFVTNICLPKVINIIKNACVPDSK